MSVIVKTISTEDLGDVVKSVWKRLFFPLIKGGKDYECVEKVILLVVTLRT
jgi:hypothetical protein